MTNIEKLYELAGVEKRLDCKHYSCGDDWHNDHCDIDKGQDVFKDVCDKGYHREKTVQNRLKCPYCEVEDYGYPSFTDTKQLELIKWLASEQNDVEISWYSDTGFRIYNFLDSCEHKDFSQALAGLVCELWEDLTEAQREEVKEILCR